MKASEKEPVVTEEEMLRLLAVLVRRLDRLVESEEAEGPAAEGPPDEGPVGEPS